MNTQLGVPDPEEAEVQNKRGRGSGSKDSSPLNHTLPMSTFDKVKLVITSAALLPHRRRVSRTQFPHWVLSRGKRAGLQITLPLPPSKMRKTRYRTVMSPRDHTASGAAGTQSCSDAGACPNHCAAGFNFNYIIISRDTAFPGAFT